MVGLQRFKRCGETLVSEILIEFINNPKFLSLRALVCLMEVELNEFV